MTQSREDQLREEEVATLKKIAHCLEQIAEDSQALHNIAKTMELSPNL